MGDKSYLFFELASFFLLVFAAVLGVEENSLALVSLGIGIELIFVTYFMVVAEEFEVSLFTDS
jgi:hypothetical protein